MGDTGGQGPDSGWSVCPRQSFCFLILKVFMVRTQDQPGTRGAGWLCTGSSGYCYRGYASCRGGMAAGLQAAVTAMGWRAKVVLRENRLGGLRQSGMVSAGAAVNVTGQSLFPVRAYSAGSASGGNLVPSSLLNFCRRACRSHTGDEYRCAY